jgi:hypothetical protein
LKCLVIDGAPVESHGKNCHGTVQESRGLKTAHSNSYSRTDFAYRSSIEDLKAALSQQSQPSKGDSRVLRQSGKGLKATHQHAPATKPIIPVESLLSSESESEIPSTKSPLQPRRAPRTPMVPKRTNSMPVRPRLSEAIPAPAATSDIEPETDTGRFEHEAKAVTAFPSFEPLVFPAGSYTIQLILDEREVKSTKNRDYMLVGLKKRGLNATKRSLEVGDICWVAQSNNAINESCTECVLDYIVERKRMDDLKGSILDGRFHEQKVS